MVNGKFPGAFTIHRRNVPFTVKTFHKVFVGNNAEKTFPYQKKTPTFAAIVTTVPQMYQSTVVLHDPAPGQMPRPAQFVLYD